MKKYKNILLIDDDEDYLFLTKQALLKLQIFETVTILTDAGEALNFIRENCIENKSDNCPSVIFIDNKMPSIDGFTFLERFIQMEESVFQKFQVYMVSAFTNDVDKKRLNNYNIKGFINKPLTLEILKNLFK